jgi:hypothetical protein
VDTFFRTLAVRTWPRVCTEDAPKLPFCVWFVTSNSSRGYVWTHSSGHWLSEPGQGCAPKMLPSCLFICGLLLATSVVNMCEHILQDIGCQSLAKGLEVSQRLTHLWLSKCDITSDGLAVLGRVVSKVCACVCLSVCLSVWRCVL